MNIESEIMNALREHFLNRKRASEQAINGPINTRWWKWTSTATVSIAVIRDITECRRVLYRMLKDGKVEKVRRSGILLWAPAQPPHGFKQHQFQDYYERA